MDTKAILETLGITREELAEKMISRAVENLLAEIVEYTDHEGEDATARRASPFARIMEQRIKERIDAEITRIAEAHVLPNLTDKIENLIIQETNQYGEKVGKPTTFIEYLIGRAETYLTEKVDHDGKSKGEAGSYGWTGAQTRVTHIVHRHLQHSIAIAMQDAVKNANKLLVEGLQETARIKLGEIAASLKVNVAVR